MPTWVPVVISFSALLVSGFSLGWNVYRDVILKPRLRVGFGVKRLAVEGKLSDRFLTLTAVNMGAGQVSCLGITVKKVSRKWLKKKVVEGYVVPEFNHPYATHKLPHKLNMAEQIDFYFTLKDDCFLAFKPTHVGIYDNFGRTHWASKEQTARAVQTFSALYPKAAELHHPTELPD